MLASWIKAVSYTHLDVYKRQDQLIAGRGLFLLPKMTSTMCCVWAAIQTVKAVSYTHLDVYKRQEKKLHTPVREEWEAEDDEI